MNAKLKSAMLVCGLLSLFIFASAAESIAKGYPWLNHAAPFDFLFDNEIDNYQQSQIQGNRLKGFFYIDFIDDLITEGLPTATHGQESVGWILNGIATNATFTGFTAGGHPQFCLNVDEVTNERGFTHFHWTGDISANELVQGQVYDGYLLKLTAVTSFYFIHFGDFFIMPGIDFYSHENVIPCS